MPFSPSPPLPEWLQSKLELLSMSQEVTLVGSWESEEDNDEVLWSNEVFRIFEIPKVEGNYISRSVFYQCVHPDDVSRVRLSTSQLKEKDFLEVDYRIITPQHKLKYLHAWYRRVSKPGEKLIIRGTVQDITRQRELEKSLRELNAELLLQNQTFLQAEMIGGSGHWQYNLKTKKCNFSANFFHLLDLPERAFHSLSDFLTYVDPVDRQRIESQLLSPTNEFNSSFKIKTAKEKELYVKSNGRIIHDINGDDTFIGIMIDITDEERLRQELHKRTSFAEQLVNLSTESITVFDQDERIIEWNPATEKLFGFKREDILGKRVTEFIPSIRNTERHQLVRKTLNGEEFDRTNLEFSIRKGFGDAYYRPLKNDAGETYAALLMIYDTTNEVQLRRILEERTHIAEKVIDSIDSMISVFDKDLNIIQINSAVEKRYKQPKEEVIGKNILEAYPSLKGTQRLNDLQRALNGESIFYEDIPFLDGKGYHNNLILPLKDNNGAVFGVLAVSHDITAIKKAEVELRVLNEQLEKKNLELEKMNAELSSFTYMASHDLQEPLRKIQLFGSKVVEKEADSLSATGKDYLKRMVNSSNRMQSLINDLLSFSRVGSQQAEMTLVDLNGVLSSVRTSLKERTEELGARINSTGLPKIKGIEFQLIQLFENILSNSLKYHDKDKRPEIDIQCELIQSKQDNSFIDHQSFYRIAFKDNGIGFDPHFSEHIFGMFHRLHGKGEFPGTGLGLAICKKIVELHNGTISAQSQPGEGATFVIHFPVPEEQI